MGCGQSKSGSWYGMERYHPSLAVDGATNNLYLGWVGSNRLHSPTGGGLSMDVLHGTTELEDPDFRAAQPNLLAQCERNQRVQRRRRHILFLVSGLMSLVTNSSLNKILEQDYRAIERRGASKCSPALLDHEQNTAIILPRVVCPNRI